MERRRRRNTLGNAQAHGLQTLISSGERPEGPTEGVCGFKEPLETVSLDASARKRRAQNRSVYVIHEDSSTALTTQSRKTDGS